MRLTQQQSQCLHDDKVTLLQLEPQEVSSKYLQWLSDPSVVRFLEVRFGRRDRDTILEFVQNCLDAPNALLLAVRSSGDDSHIGNVKLSWNADHQVGDLGVMIGDTESHSRGFATHAVALLSDHAFSALGLRKIIAGIYRSNVASVRVFEKVGYGLEAVLRDQVVLNGHAEDVLIYSLYPSSRQALRAPGDTPKGQS